MKLRTCSINILIALLLISCGSGKTFKQPRKLRCEYKENPLGIDVLKPRLSWQLNDTSRGAYQTAYQILVASDLTMLKKEKGDVWDSRKRESKQSVLVPYEGPELTSRQKCYWKVRTWDQNDRPSSWSEPASWEMGLLSSADWKASWVGMDLIAEEQALRKYGHWITHPGQGSGQGFFIRKGFGISIGSVIVFSTMHLHYTAKNGPGRGT